MAVVINEFEVMPRDSGTGERGATSSTSEGDEKPPPSAREIERLIEQRLQRGERVWAH